MSETSKWDDYFVRVGRYLDSRDIESEELNYKRETAQELARYRDELLSQQAPISIKPNNNLKNLGGFLKFPDVLKWLSTGAGADALRELWARDDHQQPANVPQVDEVIERVRRFSRRLPGEILQGPGTRMRPISVLLMALGAEQYPVFMTTIFKSTYAFTKFEEPRKDADEADLYAHAITFLDRFVEEARKRGRDTPGNRLEAQSLVWALNKRRDPDPPSLLRDLADRLLLPSDFLTNIEMLLDDKRQVIFQGPPGTAGDRRGPPGTAGDRRGPPGTAGDRRGPPGTAGDRQDVRRAGNSGLPCRRDGAGPAGPVSPVLLLRRLRPGVPPLARSWSARLRVAGRAVGRGCEAGERGSGQEALPSDRRDQPRESGQGVR